ncbi:hypothetical protein OIU76_015454 [Salix suchowensis]|nr:hypothetical protein OIU76_015454 [Salix suchowensis]
MDYGDEEFEREKKIIDYEIHTLGMRGKESLLNPSFSLIVFLEGGPLGPPSKRLREDEFEMYGSLKIEEGGGVYVLEIKKQQQRIHRNYGGGDNILIDNPPCPPPSSPSTTISTTTSLLLLKTILHNLHINENHSLKFPQNPKSKN